MRDDVRPYHVNTRQSSEQNDHHTLANLLFSLSRSLLGKILYRPMRKLSEHSSSLIGYSQFRSLFFSKHICLIDLVFY